MSSIVRNGTEFVGNYTEDRTMVFFTERTFCDVEGNNIPDTYIRKGEYGKNGGIYGENLRNSIYRGKDITSYFTDGSLYTRISSGTFDDLYIGDFFNATINNQNVVCRLAGFDIYWPFIADINDYTVHHTIIVPDSALINEVFDMNQTNTTEYGYAGSKMYKEFIPLLDGYLKTTFGDHVSKIYLELSNGVNPDAESAGNHIVKGHTDGTIYKGSHAMLMSEMNVFGTKIFSSNIFDEDTRDVQFPLFSLNPTMINPSRNNYWLRAVASAKQFVYVSSAGLPAVGLAGAKYRLRPFLSLQ